MPSGQRHEPSGGQSPENLPRAACEQRAHRQGEGEAGEKQRQPQQGPGRGGPTLWGLNPRRHSSGRRLPSLRAVARAWSGCRQRSVSPKLQPPSLQLVSFFSSLSVILTSAMLRV